MPIPHSSAIKISYFSVKKANEPKQPYQKQSNFGSGSVILLRPKMGMVLVPPKWRYYHANKAIFQYKVSSNISIILAVRYVTEVIRAHSRTVKFMGVKSHAEPIGHRFAIYSKWNFWYQEIEFFVSRNLEFTREYLLFYSGNFDFLKSENRIFDIKKITFLYIKKSIFRYWKSTSTSISFFLSYRSMHLM